MPRRPRLKLLLRPVRLFCYKKGKQRWDGGRNENRKRAGCECSSPVNAEVRQRRHGHCGWRCRGGGEGEKGGGLQALSQASCLGTPSTAHFLPAEKCPNPQHPRLQLKPCSVKPDREQLRPNTSLCLHFLPDPLQVSLCEYTQTFRNTDI